MVMVTELVVKLFDSVNLYCFSICLLSNFFHPLVLRKSFLKIFKLFFANVLVTASWVLYYSTRLHRGEGTVGCHFGRVFENRFSPAAAAILSTVYFLPLRNAAPEHLLFMSHTFVLYFFLFCFFLYHRTAKKA